MALTPNEREQKDLLIIRGAEIDGQDLLERIRESQAQRVPLPTLAAAMGRLRMHEQRQKILTSIKDLQDRVRDCGLVETRRRGWIAALELLIKKSIRKVFFRHFLQQHRVHLKLVTVLSQLVQYLDEHDRCLRTCIDQSDRHGQEATAALRADLPVAKPTVTRKADRSGVKVS